MASDRAHILLFGATGACGTAFTEKALEAGHQLTIYARNPSKLSEATRNHAHVKVVEGTFEDSSAVTEALHHGATVLISFAGPPVPARGTPITAFYEDLFHRILEDEACSIERCLILTTPSFRVLEDTPSWTWWFLVLGIRVMGGHAYNEVTGIGRVISGLPVKRLQWTLFRVPALTSSEAKSVRACMVGQEGNGITLSRKSLVIWVLQELQERRWIGKAPALSNQTWF